MTKFLFYLKEALFNPTSFFEHQNKNPEIIHVHWVIIPISIFIASSFVNWISNTIIINELELGFFEKIFIIHMDYPFFGFVLTLFFWFRAWITLRYCGKINQRVSEINSWCISPYMIVFIALFFLFAIYVPFFANTENLAVKPGPSITSFQHGTGLLRLAVFVSDVWCLFVMYNAVSVINKIQLKKFILGATIIFFLPSVIFMVV